MGWAGFPDLFNDSAFYQGDYWSPAESSGVIVNTARCNQGSYQETTWGVKQLQNVRAQGKDAGHYLFNGNLDPFTVGKLWAATCRRNGFNPASEVLAYDCEDEGDTGTHAWGPVQVLACQAGFNNVWGSPVPWRSIRVYMNWAINRRFDWSQIVGLGAQLWYARPGGPLDQRYWPSVWAKQDGTFQGVDANGYQKTFATSNGGGTITERVSDMSTLYYTTTSDTPDGPLEAYHFAGDGIGAGAWLDIVDANLANGIAANTLSKSAIFLTRETAAVWKAAYVGGTPVTGVDLSGGVTASIDTTALAEAIASAVPQPDAVAKAILDQTAARLTA